MRVHERTPASAATIILALLAGPPSALGQTDDFCARGAWRLDGAAVVSSEAGGADDASFDAAWRPILERLAACLRAREASRACVLVQGRYDDRTFSDAVVTAVGSQQAAQQLRARARAQRVISELFGLGISAERLKEAPPPTLPSYRGVRILWQQACLPAPATPPAVRTSTRAEPSNSTNATETSAGHASRPPRARDAVVVEVSTPKPPGPFWLEAGSDLSLMVLDPENVFAPVLRVGAGWRKGWFYARVDAGVSLATRVEQRTGFEATGAAGYVPLEWLQVGLLGGHRIASSSPGRPWLEQAWFLGLEATECIWSPTPSTQLCLQQSVLPLGERTRRAQVSGDQIQRIVPVDDWLVRFGLALTLRAWL